MIEGEAWSLIFLELVDAVSEYSSLPFYLLAHIVLPSSNEINGVVWEPRRRLATNECFRLVPTSRLSADLHSYSFEYLPD